MPETAGNPADAVVERLLAQVLQAWRAFPADLKEALGQELRQALVAAAAGEPRTVLVASPTSRPLKLRLAGLVEDRSLDVMYQMEWVELMVEARGTLYLVYRRRDGLDHAWEWAPGLAMPEALMARCSEALGLALFSRDSA